MSAADCFWEEDPLPTPWPTPPPLRVGDAVYYWTKQRKRIAGRIVAMHAGGRVVTMDGHPGRFPVQMVAMEWLKRERA